MNPLTVLVCQRCGEIIDGEAYYVQRRQSREQSRRHCARLLPDRASGPPPAPDGPRLALTSAAGLVIVLWITLELELAAVTVVAAMFLRTLTEVLVLAIAALIAAVLLTVVLRPWAYG
jgi:hypothetical protein